MEEGETLEVYLDRVKKVLEEFRRLNSEKSKYEVNKKVLSSLARPYNVVAPILEANMEVMEKMPLQSLVEFFDIYDSAAEEFILLMLKDMCLNSKPDKKWCGLCNKNNHNQEECYLINSRAGSSSGGGRRGKPRKGECFQCGERGHYARDCKRKNQQEQVAQEEEIGVDYLMLAEDVSGRFSYDEDMWMIYAKGTTDHMTPYEKYFTALDKTHKAKVGLADGTFLRVEGRGDVKIMMKEGKKKTIKNVLFVPKLNRNVLSIDLMLARGYSAVMEPDKCIFHDRTGAVFGDTVWEERGPAPALRLNVIEGNLTS